MSHENTVHALPGEADLIDFPHGAAGHQGLSSTASGEMIIKPCTQAEIDFYEAAKDHPAFQAHMPIFIGKLESGDRTAAVLGSVPAGEPQIVMSAEVGQEDTKDETDTTAAEGQAVSGESEEKETKDWVPSGGKKLETGLSIVLENAAAKFKQPNVIDLKLGSRLWDDNAPEAKRQKLDQVAAETTSGSLGVRIAGEKLWLGGRDTSADIEVNTTIRDGFKTFDKHYGRSLDEAGLQKAIARFVSGPTPPAVHGRDKSCFTSREAEAMTKRLLREMESIQYVLEHEESRMYSASVLIVMEGEKDALKEALEAERRLASAPAREVNGDEDDDEDDDEEEEDSDAATKIMEVRLIDFAHAQFTPGQGPDENALRGIRSIIKILKEIID